MSFSLTTGTGVLTLAGIARVRQFFFGVRVINFPTRVLVAPAPPDAIELGLAPDLLADPLAPDPTQILGYFGITRYYYAVLVVLEFYGITYNSC